MTALDDVLDFLKTHPSVFIIAATVISIIVIYVFFTERRSNTSSDAQPTSYIELQEIPARPDQTDTPQQTIGRPLSNRLRYDRLHNEGLYENYQPRHTSVLAPVHEDQPSVSGETVPVNIVPLRNKDNVPNRNYNRVSVSDLHKRSEYTSFGEFDDFDILNPNGYNENVMRLTVDFNAKDQNYVTPVQK